MRSGVRRVDYSARSLRLCTCVAVLSLCSMSPPVILNIAVGTLVAVGGAAGYIKTRSLPSLIAGLGFGALYGASTYLIHDGQPQLGYDVGAATSIVLATVMGMRLARTKKMMPAGFITALAAAAAVPNIQKSLQLRQLTKV